jgi:hypothetical protein
MTVEQIVSNITFATSAAERSYWQAELTRMVKK